MDEKTEKPTAQTLKQAKKRGEILKSQDLAYAIFLFGLLGLISFLPSFLKAPAQEFCARFTTLLKNPSLNLALYSIKPLMAPLLMLLGFLFLLSIASHLLQTGWIWKRRRRVRKNAEKGKYIVKLILASASTLLFFAMSGKNTPLGASSLQQFLFLFKRMYFAALFFTAAFIFLGICDYFYQRWKFYKQLHLTPHELKDEQREAEVSYKIKNLIQRKK